ncbi:MAG: hypothetical protein WBE38_13460, partial [Terracidiphilus sp.]
YSGGSGSVSDTTYTVLPTISYDQVTPRQHRTFTYNPGFTFYQPTSTLNEIDQSAEAFYQYRLTQHMAVNVSDSFHESSTVFDQSSSAAEGAVSGSPLPIAPGVVAPYAERLTNTAQAQLTYQFSPVGMVGGSGTWMILNYPNLTEASGLYGSDETSGSAFYNRRISSTQYMGVNYRYSQVVAHPENSESETKTHTIYAFYTISPKHNLSISISGGPQYYAVSQTLLPASGSWGPTVTVSMGWQQAQTNFAASYSREVTGGGGLLGAFESSSANASARWRISREWSTGVNGNYAINKSVTPLTFTSTQGGHTVSGTATVEYSINQQLTVDFAYNRLHQSYNDIAAVSNNPDSDRETISLTWQFTRPLGR